MNYFFFLLILFVNGYLNDWEPILTDHLSYWNVINKDLIYMTFNFT